MKVWISAAVAAFALVTPAVAGSFKLSIDDGNVRLTQALLEEAAPSEQLKRDFLKADGTAALLQKIRQSAPDATGEDLLNAIEKTRNGEDSAPVFNYALVRDERANIAALAAMLRNDKPALEAFLNDNLGALTPKGEVKKISLTLVAGGPSLGWTFGGGAEQFLGLHLYMGDGAAVKNLLLHETFHNVYADLYDPEPAASAMAGADAATFALLTHIVNEGFAEYYAARPDYGDGPHPKLQELKDNLRRNNGRIQSIERLIEMTGGMRAAHPEDADLIEQILMDWSWNNPGYFYGLVLAKVMEGKGKDVSAYLTQPPTRLLLDCYEAGFPANYPCAGYSESFVETLRRIDAVAETAR